MFNVSKTEVFYILRGQLEYIADIALQAKTMLLQALSWYRIIFIKESNSFVTSGFLNTEAFLLLMCLTQDF
jgi:hypothetical protein